MFDVSRWKRFYLKDIFEISYGNKLDLCSLYETTRNNPDAVAFVSRTAQNNGVSAYVESINVKPFPKGTITVTVLSSKPLCL